MQEYMKNSNWVWVSSWDGEDKAVSVLRYPEEPTAGNHSMFRTAVRGCMSQGRLKIWTAERMMVRQMNPGNADGTPWLPFAEKRSGLHL